MGCAAISIKDSPGWTQTNATFSALTNPYDADGMIHALTAGSISLPLRTNQTTSSEIDVFISFLVGFNTDGSLDIALDGGDVTITLNHLIPHTIEQMTPTDTTTKVPNPDRKDWTHFELQFGTDYVIINGLRTELGSSHTYANKAGKTIEISGNNTYVTDLLVTQGGLVAPEHRIALGLTEVPLESTITDTTVNCSVAGDSRTRLTDNSLTTSMVVTGTLTPLSGAIEFDLDQEAEYAYFILGAVGDNIGTDYYMGLHYNTHELEGYNVDGYLTGTPLLFIEDVENPTFTVNSVYEEPDNA